jgi:hypothetical protein
MNRIDNTHATFLNCLRDWNDPFLNGISNNHHHHQAHKQFKFGLKNGASNGTSNASLLTTYTNQINNPTGLSGSCQRCETCRLCRSPNNTVLSDQNSSSSQKNSPRIVVNHSKSFTHQSGQLTRCKSSANVPKTIEQSISQLNNKKYKTSNSISKYSANYLKNSKDKRAKSVNKNISNSLNNTKLSINSFESDDKESVGTRTSKEDELDISNNLSPNKTTQMINQSYEHNKIQIEEREVAAEYTKDLLINENEYEYVLPLTESNMKTFDLVTSRADYGENRKQENDLSQFADPVPTILDTSGLLESTKNYLSKDQTSSSSSSIQNDDIEYDDSLKEESFDADRLVFF